MRKYVSTHIHQCWQEAPAVKIWTRMSDTFHWIFGTCIPWHWLHPRLPCFPRLPYPPCQAAPLLTDVVVEIISGVEMYHVRTPKTNVVIVVVVVVVVAATNRYCTAQAKKYKNFHILILVAPPATFGETFYICKRGNMSKPPCTTSNHSHYKWTMIAAIHLWT